MGVALPDPMAVASPVKAARVVGELAEALAYSHGMEFVEVLGDWWARRICGFMDVGCRAAGRGAEDRRGKVLEAIVDGSRPSVVPRWGEVLSYYIDSRRAAVSFLGRRVAEAPA